MDARERPHRFVRAMKPPREEQREIAFVLCLLASIVLLLPRDGYVVWHRLLHGHFDVLPENV